MQNRNENLTMRIFTALGIIFIVCGHLTCDVFTIGGLFPYYSFHVYIFLFVSGYFYNTESEDRPFKYILHKAKKLLLPYIVYNLIYGIISTVLNYKGIYLGTGISFWNLFIEPFVGGHQFGLNSPAWFVPALFVVEVLNLFGRKLLMAAAKLLHGKAETRRLMVADILMLTISLVLGILVAYLAGTGHIWGIRNMPGRWFLMLPGIQFGRMFKVYLEPLIERLKKDKKIPVLVIFYVMIFAILIVVQSIISRNCLGLAFGVVWCNSFANGPIIPFVTVITGLSFWLLVAGLLAKIPWMRGLGYVGRASYHIMTNHLLVLFVINGIAGCLMPDIMDYEAYSHDFTYQVLYAGYHGTRIINVIVCVAVPTLIYWLVSRVKLKKS